MGNMQDNSPSTASLLLPMTSPESGSQGDIWRQYNRPEKLFGCKQQPERVVTLMGNEEKKKNDLEITIDDGDGKMRPLCLDTNKLTMKR